MAKEIQLITLPSKPPAHEGVVDRLGGEQHGVVEKAFQHVTGSVRYEKFATQLGETLRNVRAATEALDVPMGDFEVSEITIGLAVSGEGNIGVATAGVEASIQVRLKRTKVDPSEA